MNLSLLGCLAMAGTLIPCLWDYDTLDQENARFPSALELITGKFPRHSREFYEWRVQDRNRKLQANVISAEHLDDLAVAHSKLGDDARAIELMLEKEQLYPGLYTTAANLGTFHVHAGDLEQGLTHIERAIEINPEAHFGREVYQALLVEYLIASRGASEQLSLPIRAEAVNSMGRPTVGFWAFVRDARRIPREFESKEIEFAVRGVLGMLRFGNHDSPVLLEALADLLLAEPDRDAKRLATRALLKASYEVEPGDQRDAYRAKAEAALAMQTPKPSELRNIELAEVEDDFRKELAQADVWWAELHGRELAWIEAGDDVEARFAETYYGFTPRPTREGEGRFRAVQKFGGLAAGVLIVIAIAYIAALPRRARIAR